MIAETIKLATMAPERRINCLQALLLAEIVRRLQDPISASHTDTPREAKPNPNDLPGAGDAVFGTESESHFRPLPVIR